MDTILWKDFNFAAGGLQGLLWRLGLYGMLIAALFALTHSSPSPYGTGNVLFEFVLTTSSLFTLLALLECAIHAGRVFRPEIDRGTLAQIVILPNRLMVMVYWKIAAAVLMMLPSTMIAVIFFLWSYTFDFYHQDDFWYVVLYLGSLWIFLLHLTIYLSLWLRYGAAGLAILVCVVNIAAFTWVVPAWDEAAFVIAGGIQIGASVFLHGWIANRLLKVAGRFEGAVG